MSCRLTEELLGYQVDFGASSSVADRVFNEILTAESSERACAWLACINPHSYAVAKSDSEFAQALRNASWLIPDGAGILLASRFLGGRIRDRITGSDIFRDIHDRMNAAGGMTVFFLGASEGTLALIRAKMAADYPRIKVAGTYSPPFKSNYSDEEIDLMIRTINAAKPDVLWVGMTAPKQEKWIYRYQERLEVRFAAAVGAVFDFYTGRVRRSPQVFQRFGLEWLPRLLQQPKRLWRRMFVSAPIFLFDVARAKASAGIR